jgi:hypothetical protein
MHFFVLDTKYRNKKVSYKNFPYEVGRSWIPEVQSRSESSSDNLQLPEKQTPRGLNRTCQADSMGISDYTNLKTILAEGEGKKKYPARLCKVCATHKKRSETR